MWAGCTGMEGTIRRALGMTPEPHRRAATSGDAWAGAGAGTGAVGGPSRKRTHPFARPSPASDDSSDEDDEDEDEADAAMRRLRRTVRHRGRTPLLNVLTGHVGARRLPMEYQHGRYPAALGAAVPGTKPNTRQVATASVAHAASAADKKALVALESGADNKFANSNLVRKVRTLSATVNTHTWSTHSPSCGEQCPPVLPALCAAEAPGVDRPAGVLS